MCVVVVIVIVVVDVVVVDVVVVSILQFMIPLRLGSALIFTRTPYLRANLKISNSSKAHAVSEESLMMLPTAASLQNCQGN